ncbi:YceI family protein [Pontibacter sp. G13]|uniref:YceI family protein n=1 Tax=Pontibacter sp. G13 TaxID=3074898 RepID=UPI00288B3ED5|nr:YceI family protein [Pontibacter sp. G13]WNJ18111.1 YceI family protein [Pontibacter sp. G13]
MRKFIQVLPLSLAFGWSILFHFQPVQAQAPLWAADSGSVAFVSDAPLELISASSKEVSGLISVANGEFAFSIPIRSFFGFNNSLQREHFLENYLEEAKFPKATFKGRIIGQVNLDRDGSYPVRAKGSFSIHGFEQDRIIPALIEVKEGKAHVSAEFSLMVADFGIHIPKVVRKKIAEEILTTVDIDFFPRASMEE